MKLPSNNAGSHCYNNPSHLKAESVTPWRNCKRVRLVSSWSDFPFKISKQTNFSGEFVLKFWSRID